VNVHLLEHGIASLVEDSSLRKPLARYVKSISQAVYRLVSELDALNVAVERSASLLNVLEDLKRDILKSVPEILEELKAVEVGGLRAQTEFASTSSKYHEIAHRYKELAGDELLVFGRELRRDVEHLVRTMVAMLEPFVKLSQQLKAKGKKIGASEAVSEKDATRMGDSLNLLLRPDWADAVGDRLPEFLEGLRLVDAWGDQAQALLGTSKKTSAAMAEAMNRFNAKDFNTQYEQWQVKVSDLRQLQPSDAYAEKNAALLEMGVAYGEIRRHFEKQSRELVRLVTKYHRVEATMAELRHEVAALCASNFGLRVEVLLPKQDPQKLAEMLKEASRAAAEAAVVVAAKPIAAAKPALMTTREKDPSRKTLSVRFVGED